MDQVFIFICFNFFSNFFLIFLILIKGGQLAIEKLSRGGRQLLDHESLACLLVLLFIDDPRMNTVKLHRVVRNLCIHGPSRGWIIRALLSILEKVSGNRSETATGTSQLAIADSGEPPSKRSK